MLQPAATKQPLIPFIQVTAQKSNQRAMLTSSTSCKLHMKGNCFANACVTAAELMHSVWHFGNVILGEHAVSPHE